MPIRILIADDHGLIRAGLHALLENVPEIIVVGEASDGYSIIKQVAEHQPDIVLMDISMPGMNGIEATSKVREISPTTQVLAMTVHEDESMLREMIRAGASGYIIKRALESELLQAIRIISQGNVYIYPSLTRALLKDVVPDMGDGGAKQDDLTAREIDVLQLLARGYTNRQIAQELSISPRTVEGHRSSLVGKLGFSSRMELLSFAEENGLLDSYSPPNRNKRSGDQRIPS